MALWAAGGCASSDEQKVSQLLERQRSSAEYIVANLTERDLSLMTPNQQQVSLPPGSVTSRFKQASGKEVTVGLQQGSNKLDVRHTFANKEQAAFLVTQGAQGFEVKTLGGELLGSEGDQVVRIINLTAEPVQVTIGRDGTQEVIGPVEPGKEATNRPKVTIGESIKAMINGSSSVQLPVREEDSFAAIVTPSPTGKPKVVLVRTRVKSTPVAAGSS